jgi:2-C-methyl-D-erythritol 4-phosphate cytidylyltransferase
MREAVGGILLAGGRGSRAGGPKQFADLNGKPLLHWSLRTFIDSMDIDHFVVVLPEGRQGQLPAAIAGMDVRKPVEVAIGGQRRQDSVRAGLSKLLPCDWVVVHDAARPMLTAAVVTDGLKAARTTGAASVGRPLTDTVKRVRDARVVETISRDGLWTVQTPQVFRRELLEQAHEQVKADVTDDAAMVELIGAEVTLFEGPATNIKVTTARDFDLAAVLLERQGQE